MALSLRINDRIRTRNVEFFNQFNVSLRFDHIASGFAFSAVFNPDNLSQKEMFCVGHDHIAEVFYKGKKLLTGYILSNGFADGAVQEMTTFGGYSLPGFLEDCQISPDNYPLQMDGLTLRQIAEKIIKPFRLSMIVDPVVSGAMNSVYEKATAEPGETIKDFLTKLATQKNILISHNENGAVLFTRANTKKEPILDFDVTLPNPIPFTHMQLGFDGQRMHSEIHVIKQADENGGNVGQSKIVNPYVPFVYRPRVIVQSAGNDVDTDLVARNALSEELKGLKLIIQTDRWEYNENGIILPNNIITVLNPKVYCYKKTKWFVEQVDFQGDQEKLTTTMTCVLPEVYNGQTPTYLWKGINLH